MGLDPEPIIAIICALLASFALIRKIKSYLDKKRIIEDKKRIIEDIKEHEKAMVRIAEMQKKWKEVDEKDKGIDDFTEEELSALPSWKQDRAMRLTRDGRAHTIRAINDAVNQVFEREMKCNLEEAQSKLESGEITEEEFEKSRESLKRREELWPKEMREKEEKQKEGLRQFDREWEDMKIRLRERKKSSDQSE